MNKKIMKHLMRCSARLSRVLRDPRVKGRSHWDFESLLGTLWQGMVSGCRSLRDIEALSASSATRVPDTTLHDILVQLDEAPLHDELARQVKMALRSHELGEQELPLRLLVIDGKEVAQTKESIDSFSAVVRRNDRTLYRQMVLRAFCAWSSVKLLVGQHRILGNTNENGIFREFYSALMQQYRNTNLFEVVSLDAGMFSKGNAEAIRKSRKHYIIALKDPKSRMITRKAVELLSSLTVPQVIVEAAAPHSNGVRRELFRAPAPLGIEGWEHACEVWRVRQTSTRKGKVVTEERYFVTSIPRKQLTNRQVLDMIRAHWSIENNANWVMDTAWKEDTKPLCSRAIALLSMLRIFAYNCVARFKHRACRCAHTQQLSWPRMLSIFRDALIWEYATNPQHTPKTLV